MNGVGAFDVVDDDVLGLFTSATNGQGSFVNIAPLTGTSLQINLRTYEVHRYGTALREQGSTSCAMLSSDIDSVVALNSETCSLTIASYHLDGRALVEVNVSTVSHIYSLKSSNIVLSYFFCMIRFPCETPVFV